MSANKDKIIKIIYIVTLSILCAFGPLCTDIYLAALPQINEFFNANAAQTQLTLTSCFLGLAFGQCVIGPISDARGRRIPLLASMIIFTVMSFLCAVATDIRMLIAYRFFQGFAGSGALVLSRSIACDKFQGPALTQFMAVLMAINSVAPVLGPVIGSLVITVANWEAIFYLLSGIGVMVTVLCLLFVGESHTPDPNSRGVLHAIGSMLKELLNLRFLFYVVSLSFIMGGFFGYISAAPFVMQVHYHLSPVGFSGAFATVTVCIAVASMLAGRMVKHTGEVKMVWFSYVVMLAAGAAVLVISLFPPESFIPILICLMFFCAMMGVSQTAGFSIVMAARRGQAGAASGIFGVMTFLFGSMTSPFMGIMGEDSIIPLGICLTVTPLMAMLFMHLAGRMKK
jgi:DHA1 family bicyclomycin/chloramphenicol resistance-like MFS transporter